jgi:hypothetical protein
MRLNKKFLRKGNNHGSTKSKKEDTAEGISHIGLFEKAFRNSGK